MKDRRIRSEQRGVALILAMLILTLAAVVTGDLIFDSYLARRRAAAQLYRDAAFQYILGAESWAREILDDDLEDSSVDHSGEDWASVLPALPIDGGLLQGQVSDMQGRFNINNLGVTDQGERGIWLAQFQRLLDHLRLQPGIAQAISDWVDADTETQFPDGAESDAYIGMDPAYAAANMSLTSVSELMAVRGMTAEAFQVLAPHITALPRGTQLNINTATPEVLASLADGVGLAEARSMADDATEGGFDSVEAFLERLGRPVEVPIGLTTEHFLLTVRVSVGTLSLTMYSRLDRRPGSPTLASARSIGAP